MPLRILKINAPGAIKVMLMIIAMFNYIMSWYISLSPHESRRTSTPFLAPSMAWNVADVGALVGACVGRGVVRRLVVGRLVGLFVMRLVRPFVVGALVVGLLVVGLLVGDLAIVDAARGGGGQQCATLGAESESEGRRQGTRRT